MSDCRFGVSPVNYPDPDSVPIYDALVVLRPSGIRLNYPERVKIAESLVGYARNVDGSLILTQDGQTHLNGQQSVAVTMFIIEWKRNWTLLL